MKLYRYITALLTSVICISCIEPFDLKYEDDPVIYLEAFPGVEDVVVFKIQPAYSLSNSAVRPEFEPHITFAVNGQAIPVSRNTGGRIGSSYPEECYVADYKPSPGDKMSVEVSAEGFRTIYAQTSIPQPFPERKIDYGQVKIGDIYQNVLYVTFKDDNHTDYAYGLQIFNEWIRMWPDQEPEINSYSYAGGQLTDDFTMAPESLDGIGLYFNGWMIGGTAGIACWDGSPFNGEEKTLSMSVMTFDFQWESDRYYRFFEHEEAIYLYDYYGNVINEGIQIEHNKLVMYSMTEEFYKYAVAQKLAGENSDFFAGLAPSNYCYSNIQNGCGAFAGVWRTETDWITQEFIENNR